ncbi:hypothetical protein MNBD_GAMMA10-1601 [hydrothermal vent metagenome]|uniref:Uncharacterized protein n=1 Tax=hydrothermal vent metagenome TaxID=652676 RepID=A0A3B0Y559_9ZZZZ
MSIIRGRKISVTGLLFVGMVLVSAVSGLSRAEQRAEFLDSPESQGWRRGLLTVKYSLRQTESVSIGDAGTNMDVNSKLAMQITSVEDVWVPADLSLVVENSKGGARKRASFSASPYFISGDLAPATSTSSISYSRRSVLQNGNARFEEAEQASGKIPAIHVENMQPSLFGAGYELTLSVNMNLVVSQRHSSFAGDSRDERIITEPFKFNLYPVPSAEVINTYPYEMVELQYLNSEYNKKMQDLQTLAMLKEKYTSAKVPYLSYCVGAITNLSKDEMSVAFSYNGANWMPMLSDTPFGKAGNTVLDIKVQLSVK